MFALSPHVPAYQLSPGESLEYLAAGLLDGIEPEPIANALDGAWVHHGGTFVLAARVVQQFPLVTEVVAMLDDRKVGVEYADAWREWLRVSNLLSMRQHSTTMTVRSLVDAGAPVLDVAGARAAAQVRSADGPVAAGPVTAVDPSDGEDSAMESGAKSAWPELYASALDEERQLIDLAWRAQAAEPEVGAEVEDGTPLDLSWPDRRVAVDAGLDEEERAVLVAAGWLLVPPQVE